MVVTEKDKKSKLRKKIVLEAGFRSGREQSFMTH